MTTTSKQAFDIKELQELLFVFKRTLRDLYRKETMVLQCSMSHLEIMQYIADHANPTMKDIAAHLQITPPSVTTLVETMVEHGLVKREAASGDRRTIRVRLTPKAAALYKSLQLKKKTLLTALLKKLSVEQKSQLSDIVRTLTK